MPFMMNEFYQPQLQAGQLQEQKDVHQLRLAEIAKMQLDAQNQQANREAAQRIFGGTGVQSAPTDPTAQAPTEDQTYLSQISQQTQLANKQEKMGTFLATTGQLKASEDAFKSARDTRKSAEDLAVRQQLEHKRKLDQLGSILGPVSDQPSYDNAVQQLKEVNPQFAAQLPKEYNPSTARMVSQLADSTMTRAQQLDKDLKIQKDKELQDYRKDRMEEQRQARIDRNTNQVENRELSKLIHRQGAGAKKDSYTKDSNAYTAEVTNLYKNVQKDISKINLKVKTSDLTPAQAKESIDELRSDYHRNIEAAADKYRARGVNIPQLYKGEVPAPKTGGVSTTKPANMSDTDWKEYQAYVKSQGGK